MLLSSVFQTFFKTFLSFLKFVFRLPLPCDSLFILPHLISFCQAFFNTFLIFFKIFFQEISFGWWPLRSSFVRQLVYYITFDIRLSSIFRNFFQFLQKVFSIDREGRGFNRFPCDSLLIISLSKNKVNCFSAFFATFLTFFSRHKILYFSHQKDTIYHKISHFSSEGWELNKNAAHFFLAFSEKSW